MLFGFETWTVRKEEKQSLEDNFLAQSTLEGVEKGKKYMTFSPNRILLNPIDPIVGSCDKDEER